MSELNEWIQGMTDYMEAMVMAMNERESIGGGKDTKGSLLAAEHEIKVAVAALRAAASVLDNLSKEVSVVGKIPVRCRWIADDAEAARCMVSGMLRDFEKSEPVQTAVGE